MGSTNIPHSGPYAWMKRADTESSRYYSKLIRESQINTTRLNFQHRLSTAVNNGHLVRPTIPLSGIKNVADVATGTGLVPKWNEYETLNPDISSIWLEDLHEKLSRSGSSDLRFDGFDISSEMFPKHGKSSYFVQDLLEPFPSEYHGTYDLVHVQFLHLAPQKEKFRPAAKNLLQLLSEYFRAPLKIGTTLTDS